MKNHLLIRAVILLASLCSGLLLQAQTNSENYVWTNGFLEKQYAVTPDVMKKSLSTMFQKCLPIRVAIVTEPTAMITTYGVGDNSGDFQLGKAGGTIAVKLIPAESSTTVGFKIGDGDRKLSENLHRLLANRLDNDTAPRKESDASNSKTVGTVGPDDSLAEFGKEISSTGEGDVGNKGIKCNVTISAHGSSTGGMTPQGMKQYEFLARIENLSDTDGRLGLGPFQLIDGDGRAYTGIIYNGPVQVVNGPFGAEEMVMGEITGDPSTTMKVSSKAVIDKIHIFVTMPADSKSKELRVVFGAKEARTLHFKTDRWSGGGN